MKIKSLKKTRFKGFVYNIAVKDDESYIANQIVVHNCRTDLIPFTKIEAEETPPTVVSLDDEEAKLRATGKAGAVRGVGFGGTQIIKEKKQGFEITSSRNYEHSGRADVYIASTGSVIDTYNILSIKDASILYLINLDARNIEIEKVAASNDFKHGTVKLIKNMRIEGDGEIKGGERITPVAVGRGQVKANVRCMIWDGSGNGMEGLVDGEVIKTTILKEGDNKASLGTIVLKTGESLAMKYDYDMNVRGQLVGGGDFECSVRFSYEG